MDRESSIWQESTDPDGTLPCAINISRSIEDVGEEAASTRVSVKTCCDPWWPETNCLIHSFMADKIMPLSQAVEGYDIFDKMKAQKVVFEAEK